MLHVNRTTKWATLAAVCLILFAGGLRLVQVGAWRATGVPLACLGSMIYVGLLLGWGISLDHRLTDRRVKKLLLASIALMVLWFVLRCAKYDFFDAYDTVQRLLWYGYYIPMNFLPTLTFLAARSIGRVESRSLRREALRLLLPDVLFTAPIPDPGPEQTDPPPLVCPIPLRISRAVRSLRREIALYRFQPSYFWSAWPLLAAPSSRSISQRSARIMPMTSGRTLKTSRETDFTPHTDFDTKTVNKPCIF